MLLFCFLVFCVLILFPLISFRSIFFFPTLSTNTNTTYTPYSPPNYPPPQQRPTHRTTNNKTTGAIFNIKVISNFSSTMHAQNVVIKIPCPKTTARCKCRAKEGRARYEPEHHAIVWRIKRFPGRKELRLHAEAELAASTSGKAWSRPPITMEFSCPRFAASGMIVRFLKVFEKTAYQTTKWVRYITRNGHYQIRI